MKRAIKSAIDLAFKVVARRTAPVGKFVWRKWNVCRFLEREREIVALLELKRALYN